MEVAALIVMHLPACDVLRVLWDIGAYLLVAHENATHDVGARDAVASRVQSFLHLAR
jgi:hypothetical protein